MKWLKDRDWHPEKLGTLASAKEQTAGSITIVARLYRAIGLG